nr:MAG TPA: hypothetical protein [Caudoviricetes sp.]
MNFERATEKHPLNNKFTLLLFHFRLSRLILY